MILEDNIFVFDDIVPDWIYEHTIKNIANIPVTFGHSGLGPYQGYSFFSKVWTRQELEQLPWYLSASFYALNNARRRLGDVTNLELVQTQLNITTKNLTGNLHVDSGPDVPSWTMVHLITGDSGMDFWTNHPDHNGTKIKEIEYKDNRCIIFPSSIFHRGLTCIEAEPRISVGYVFGGQSTPFAKNNNIIYPIFKNQNEQIMPHDIRNRI